MLGGDGLLNIIIKGNIEGSVELKVRGGRTRKQLLDDCTKRIVYWKLKRKTQELSLCCTRFGRSY